MTAPTCIVLGGHGFVGSAIVREAEQRGFAVHAVGRAEYEEAKGTACDLLINANGNSKKFLARQDPVLDFQYSVESVLRSCMDFTPERYVFLSSIDVYPCVSDPARNAEDTPIDPARLAPYGFHKYVAEQVARYHHPAALILRMGGFVGSGLWKNPVFDLINGHPLRVHPDSAYQYLNTADLAACCFDWLDQHAQGDTLNVAGQGTVTLREIAQMIPDALLPEADDAIPLEHYEINIDKLAAHRPIPDSRATVWRFITDVTNAAVTLGKPGVRT